jgi:hypothetical protein
MISEDGQTIYVSTTTGMFKTTDGGVNWAPLITRLSAKEFRQVSTDGLKLYMNDGYFTTDGGITWSADTKPPTYNNTASWIGAWWYSKNLNTGYFQPTDTSGNALDGTYWKRTLATNSLVVSGISGSHNLVFNQSHAVSLRWVYRFIHANGASSVNVKPTSVFSNTVDRTYTISRTG